MFLRMSVQEVLWSIHNGYIYKIHLRRPFELTALVSNDISSGALYVPKLQLRNPN